MVSREEVAGLVVEWLQREGFHETVALFKQEAKPLLDRLILPKERRPQNLVSLLSSYVMLQQKKKRKMELRQTLQQRYPAVLPHMFHSLVKLLDDYASFCSTSTVPPSATVSTSSPVSIATATSSRALAPLPLPLATTTASASAPARRGRGRKPQPRLPAPAIPPTIAPLHPKPTNASGSVRSALLSSSSTQVGPPRQQLLFPGFPSSQSPVPRGSPTFLPPPASPLVTNPQIPPHHQRPTSLAAAADTPLLSASTRLTSSQMSPPPAAATARLARPSVSPSSKRKQRTPHKRRASAESRAAPAAKAPRLDRPEPTDPTFRSAAPDLLAGHVGGGDPSSPPHSPSDSDSAAFMGSEDQLPALDDALLEILLNSALPEKLAEQINKSLLSEKEESTPAVVTVSRTVEQQQQQQKQQQQQQIENPVEAVYILSDDDEKKDQDSKIEEIAEAITHEPAFEALLAQWDAEALSDEDEENKEEEGGNSKSATRATEERYEKIVNEYDDDVITDDDEEEKEVVEKHTAVDESEEETMKITDDDDDEDEDHETSGEAERQKMELVPQVAEKLKHLDVEAFLNTIHGSHEKQKTNK